MLLRTFFLFVSSGLAGLLLGCSSSNSGSNLPVEQVDAESPTVRDVIPPTLQNNIVATNSAFTLEFSELMDEDSLVDYVKLRSLKSRDLSSTSSIGSVDAEVYDIDERPLSLDFSNYIYTSTITEIISESVDEDGVIQNETRDIVIEKAASAAHAVPQNGRLSLWSFYAVELGKGIRDLSPISSISPVDGSSSTGNYISNFALEFGTDDGSWRASKEVNGQFSIDTYSVSNFDFVSSQDSSEVLWVQAAPAPLDFSQLYLREYDQTVQEFTSAPQRVDIMPGIDGASLSNGTVIDFSAKRSLDSHCFAWSSAQGGINTVYLRCGANNSYQSRIVLSDHSAASPISSLKLELNDDGVGFVSYIYDGQYFIYAFEARSQSPAVVLDVFSSNPSLVFDEIVTELVSTDRGSVLNLASSVYDAGGPLGLRHRLEHHRFEFVSGALSRQQYLISEGSEPSEKLSFGFDYLGRGVIGWVEGAGKDRLFFTSTFNTVEWLTRVPVAKNGESSILEGSVYVFNDGQAIFAWVQSLNGTLEIKAQGIFPQASGGFVRPQVLTLASSTVTMENVDVIGDREGNAFVYWNNGARISYSRFRQNIAWESAWGEEGRVAFSNRKSVIRPLTEDGRMVLLTTQQASGYEALNLDVFSDFD